MKAASCFGETWKYNKILSKMAREMLVWINERETKTQKGQENGHKRAFQPKIYATGTERCPIKLNKFFRDHRPVEMKQPNSDSSGSHHLPENPTSNGGLLTPEVACENIHASSLLAARDVSRGGTSATQRQKFHTDDVKSVRNPVRSADWSTE